MLVSLDLFLTALDPAVSSHWVYCLSAWLSLMSCPMQHSTLLKSSVVRGGICKLSLNTPLTLTHPLRYSKPWAHTRMFPLESIFNRFPYVVSYTRPLERRGERERTFETTSVWEYSVKWIINIKTWPSKELKQEFIHIYIFPQQHHWAESLRLVFSSF